MDWFPTVLELCGLKWSADAPQLDGHSLLPMIESRQAESKYGGVLYFAWGTKWAVRDGEWKLIGAKGRENVSLHRLTDAEPEKVNYAKEKPEIVAKLEAMHEAWTEDVKPK